MLKKDKTGGVFIRVKLADEALIQWYNQQPAKGRSRAVSAAIAQGVSVQEGQMVIIDCTLQELLGRVETIETQLLMTQMALVEAREDIDQLEPRVNNLATSIEAIEEMASTDNNNLAEVH